MSLSKQGDSEGQGNMASWNPWVHKESDTTDKNIKCSVVERTQYFNFQQMMYVQVISVLFTIKNTPHMKISFQVFLCTYIYIYLGSRDTES